METQELLVGTIECSWWKFTIRSRRASEHLLLPHQFQKRLKRLLLIGQKKKTISGQSAKPDDSSFFLHDEESFLTKC